MSSSTSTKSASWTGSGPPRAQEAYPPARANGTPAALRVVATRFRAVRSSRSDSSSTRGVEPITASASRDERNERDAAQIFGLAAPVSHEGPVSMAPDRADQRRTRGELVQERGRRFAFRH